jgi:hypothetical protein
MEHHALNCAQRLDQKLDAEARAIVLPSFKEVLASIRVYLLKQNSEVDQVNNIYQLLKEKKSGPVGLIALGPEFDAGPTDFHYRLRSGSRLSFGITLHESNSRCSLVAYRFHLHIGGNKGPTFFRFDLNRSAHVHPLVEPRSHMHPGQDNVRLPSPALEPLEVLDRIFHVIATAE